MNLNYKNFEKLSLSRPADRIKFIAELCREKTVLDLGCFDETALQKHDTEYWLHGRISKIARRVIGIDNSKLIPADGIKTGDTSSIRRGDAINLDLSLIDEQLVEIIVAGEFIEHIENPQEFLRNICGQMPGRTLVISTPNGVSVSNTLMGVWGREVQHPDHLYNFTYKTLNTLCLRAGFTEWEIIPYRFYATEMILKSRGATRLAAITVEKIIRVIEYFFPLLSFGYIVKIKV